MVAPTIINLSSERWTDERLATTFEIAENLYMEGFADEESGDVEAPTGHFYRMHCAVIVTDNYGFKTMTMYPSKQAAMATFENLEVRYAEWADAVEQHV